MQTITSTSVLHQVTTFEIEGLQYKAILFNSCLDPLFTDIGCTSIFQHKAYHRALESAPPDKMNFWYVRIEQEYKLAGILCFQVKDFNPGDSLKNQVNGNLVRAARYKTASLINLSVLCLGNTLVTGDYGFCFQPWISDRMQTVLMMETIDWMLTLKSFKKIGLVFVKDFYKDIFSEIPDSPYCKKYHAIDTQPSMIMDIPSEWGNFQGYLQSLKSKYRIRANKALKVARDIECIELHADEIEAMEPQLHQLYLKVVDDVGFNLFILSQGYFSALKKSLGDKFRLWIYKDKGELISFFTVFEDGDILDAHFLGYDPEVNHKYKLYLNMLLRMIDLASTRGFRQLQLSRTATEIKSSVGAQGVPMWAYMRAPNKAFNSLVPRLYSFFKPDLEWVPRNPYHEVGF
ncbi:MAG: GNAT family N-acetyltransferase [Saprospiraceae bacterium]|nr:GNAT family N-acetyltransferase [Candidatus Opimibacter skivensis]